MRPELSLTRRGWVVLAVVVAGLAMGWEFGGRSLNYVVVPAAALLVVGAVGVARADAPTVYREAPSSGVDGEHCVVRLSVEAARSPAVVVEDRIPASLDGTARFETVADGEEHSYELRLAERGVHTLGPATVEVRDVFGLWTRSFEAGDTAVVEAFPRSHPLYESTGVLSGYVGLTQEREQFDSIREYHPGDALRDVNWKASAKRSGDLVVTEYAGEGASNAVVVAVGASPDADTAAEAAASIVAHLLDAGIAVGLLTADASVDPAVGPGHRRKLLSVLARYDGRRGISDEAGADVAVRGYDGPVRIEAGGTSHEFGDIVAPDAAEVTG